MHIYVHLKDASFTPVQYARKMLAAAEAELPKAVKRAAEYTVIFGGSDPTARKAMEEVDRHRENIRLWRQYSQMNAQALAKIIRNKEIPASAFGYGVE